LLTAIIIEAINSQILTFQNRLSTLTSPIRASSSARTFAQTSGPCTTLPFDGHLSTGITDEKILSNLLTLTVTLLHCSHKYLDEQPNDVVFCIKCIHFLRDLSHKVPRVTRDTLTILLVKARALQFELVQLRPMDRGMLYFADSEPEVL
jgi:hypothetical protein